LPGRDQRAYLFVLLRSEPLLKLGKPFGLGALPLTSKVSYKADYSCEGG
ncbi:MAG: hypothetical protein K0Q43_1871, partial [Ramlibacter sp.]|nr:hypothetical protein [Ramlibacter sp.]